MLSCHHIRAHCLPTVLTKPTTHHSPSSSQHNPHCSPARTHAHHTMVATLRTCLLALVLLSCVAAEAPWFCHELVRALGVHARAAGGCLLPCGACGDARARGHVSQHAACAPRPRSLSHTHTHTTDTHTHTRHAHLANNTHRTPQDCPTFTLLKNHTDMGIELRRYDAGESDARACVCRARRGAVCVVCACVCM
jgi:hypothetical protein